MAYPHATMTDGDDDVDMLDYRDDDNPSPSPNLSAAPHLPGQQPYFNAQPFFPQSALPQAHAHAQQSAGDYFEGYHFKYSVTPLSCPSRIHLPCPIFALT